MQAIVTKYFGPGNVRGSRVKATCQAGHVTLGWDDSLNPEANHKAAAFALASSLEWNGVWICGWIPDGSCVWVCDPQDARDTFTVPTMESKINARMAQLSSSLKESR